jgi:hypothetical protein
MDRLILLLEVTPPTDPDFLPRSSGYRRVCGFHKESRMKFANATNLDRKSGFDSAEPEIFHQVENKHVNSPQCHSDATDCKKL